MSSGVSSVDFTDDLPDPEDEEFLVPGVEVGVGEADATLGADELPEDWPIVIWILLRVQADTSGGRRRLALERSSRDFRLPSSAC